MTNTPSIEQFTDADFNVLTPDFIDGDPTITVENATLSEPFYFEVDVDTWSRLNREALCETEDDDYAPRALEVETTLYEDYGISL